MKHRAPALNSGLFTLLALLLVPTSASAQTPGLEAEDQDVALHAQILKPFLKDVDESASSALLLVSGRNYVGQTGLVIEVLMAHIDEPRILVPAGLDPPTFYEAGGKETRFWNPYFGIELGGPGASWVRQMGFRIDAREQSESGARSYLMGDLADPERPTAFSHITTFQAGAIRRPRRALNRDYRMRLTATVPLDGHLSAWFLTYRGMLVLKRGAWGLEGGVVGSALVDRDSGLSFGERFSSQFEVILRTQWGPVRPLLSARVWLNQDERDLAPVVAGLGLEWLDRKQSR